MKLYDILLHTPLGKKKGTLNATIQNGEVNGSLSLLGHTEPIVGTVDSTGHCTLQGMLVTLVHALPFTAVGHMSEDTLHLTLSSQFGSFQMMGQKGEH